jgi:ABC-type transport system substrate-binding protein
MFADGGKRGVNGRKPGARGEQPGGGLGHFGRWSRPLRALGLFAVAALAAVLSAPAWAAADPAKVLRVSFDTAESGFDPVRVADANSASVLEAIFDRLLTYDYLARPARLVPMAAEAMPEMSDNGRTYTFRLRRGIRFTPDPAFKGVARELTAQDFVYSFMRFLDPANRAPYAFMLEGKIRGLDALAAAAKKSGRFDYDAKLPDLEAVDRYTLRVRLARTDFNFPYVMAHTSFGAVAREVVAAYGSEIAAHPVGTGPYMLAEWTRAAKIVLVANPGFRKVVWDFRPSPGDAWDARVAAAMTGKTIPQIGRVEIYPMEEPQTRWLAFNQKQLDMLNLPSTFRTRVFEPDGALKAAWVDELVSVYTAVDPEIVYAFLNVRDPVVGGFAKEKVALRRAIILAYKVDEDIHVIRRGMAVPAEMPIPPGVVGHDPAYRSLNQRDPGLANRLLDRFGYKRGADGYRRMPDGKPLVIRYASSGSVVDREHNELWRKSLDAIGVRIEFDTAPFVENQKAARACKLMMWESSWSADYPDGDNFMQLLYGPNSGQSNNGCYESKAFDAFYEKSRELPDSPERNRLFLEMSRQMEVDGAWSLHLSRERKQLLRPWAKGFKKHPILGAEWIYMDVQP